MNLATESARKNRQKGDTQMSIEQELARIAAALEKISGGQAVDLVPVVVAPKKVKGPKYDPDADDVKADIEVTADKAKKAAAKKETNELFDEEPKEAKLVVSEESVREIVKMYAETESPEKAMELLKKFKVKRLRELKPEQYAEVVAVFTEALDA